MRAPVPGHLDLPDSARRRGGSVAGESVAANRSIWFDLGLSAGAGWKKPVAGLRYQTHVGWLRFLKQLHREVPRGLDIHVIADNYATHKHANVKVWLNKHMHFTPTSSSWMHLVERFFADLTEDCVRNGSFASVKELKDSIVAYLEERNRAPKPYRGKASGAEILGKLQRARQALEQGGRQLSAILIVARQL